MAFELPELPYARDALEPHISSKTIDFHYGKHHQTYVNTLNGMVEGTDNANKTLEELIASTSGPMFNQAAQIWNHTFYWHCLSPNGGGQPTGELSDAINSTFGSFDEFVAKFNETAIKTFGSGWAWLVKNKAGELELVSTSNAGCPLTDDSTPLLTCDVWEHAYYIDYKNARPAYVDSFWKLVNWDFVADNFKK